MRLISCSSAGADGAGDAVTGTGASLGLRPIRPRCAAAAFIAAVLIGCCTSQVRSPGRPGASPLTPTAASSGGSSASIVYVSPDGLDSNPGTQGAPWGTLGRALLRLQPGQTLVVGGGGYRERIYAAVRAGTASRPIIVRAAVGQRPVVRGLLWLIRPSFWTIEGINVVWDPANHDSQKHMVRIFGGQQWRWTESELWGARSFAAFNVAPGPDGDLAKGWSISKNCIHDTHPSGGPNQDQLLYINPGGADSGGLVEANVLFGSPNGSAIKLGGPNSTFGAMGVTVRYNTTYENVRSVNVTWRSGHNRIYGNLFVRPLSDAPIRAFELSGSANVAHGNAWWGTPSLIENDPGYGRVRDGGGNVAVNPEFDSVSGCDGFRPTNPEAEGFGRYALPLTSVSPSPSVRLSTGV